LRLKKACSALSDLLAFAGFRRNLAGKSWIFDLF